jgi:HAD superfamily phosphoserine phosphatase-like hydrolase
MKNPAWIVVSDFDGTFTQKDVGNELCKEVIPELFADAHTRYRAGSLGLKELQQTLWQKFPMSEKLFRERAVAHGKLRPGVNDFLEKCADRGIPVFVASCGLLPYIESVLDAQLTPKARRAVLEIKCNEARFDAQGISHFIPPATAADCPYPLDKGDWSKSLQKRYPGSKIYGFGNGTSDRSFVGHVDKLAATEALADWAEKSKVPFKRFHDFTELLNIEIFSEPFENS